MSTNLYTVTPRQAAIEIEDCLRAGLIPFIKSSPGMGKSSIMSQVFRRLNLFKIDLRTSASAPEDFNGLPNFTERGAEFVPFADQFPVEGTPVPAGYDGWGIFFDEANAGVKMVQAAMYKTLLDRMVGQKHLHERVAMAAAGNLATDRSIVNDFGTALQSRVITFILEISFNEWLEDVALAENYDPRIISYLSYKNGMLMNFQPDHDDNTFPCPRTWEFLNKLITTNGFDEKKAASYAGSVGVAAAAEFIQHAKVHEQLPDENRILQDPKNCAIPTDNATRWATISHLLDKLVNNSGKVEEAKFERFTEYANRFDMTFRILFFRGAKTKAETLRRHPAFLQSMSELSRYLND